MSTNLSADDDDAVHDKIIELLLDQDGEVPVSESLQTLLYLVAGICLLGKSPAHVLAEQFSAGLFRTIADNTAQERKLQ